jgi:putative membrane protein
MKCCKIPFRFTFAILVTALAFPAISLARPVTSATQLPTGKQFITKAAQVNLGEIALGKLAEQKATDPAVKDFGALMVRQHTELQQLLETLGKNQGIALPAKLGAKQVALKHRLENESGQQFDNDYIQHMLSGHRRAIAMLDNEIEHGTNPAYKAYAEKGLPILQDHIRIAEDVAGKMGSSGEYGLYQPSTAINAGTRAGN